MPLNEKWHTTVLINIIHINKANDIANILVNTLNDLFIFIYLVGYLLI
jgi:hypothetical protein